MKKDEKNRLREEKRAVKKAGVRKARRALQRTLVDDPDEAHLADIDYTHTSSAGLNGIDRDMTRRRWLAETKGSNNEADGFVVGAGDDTGRNEGLEHVAPARGDCEECGPLAIAGLEHGKSNQPTSRSEFDCGHDALPVPGQPDPA